MNFIYKELSPFMVMSNKDLLTRIFDNLLTNASKYNKPNGSVIVMVSNYHITIQDTGKGIKDVKKVLQRYYREQERGLGLGLHIVQKLTQELNIELQITSEVKVGTAVSLRFQKSKESIYEE
jgi:two-component system OmpR family sensor kinase